jgi:LDH2 family malate/lactate/ureidoglycolate dehydrogenase
MSSAPKPEQTTVTVPAEEVGALVIACFEHLGISRTDAEAVAEALLYASLRGIDSHGFERVPVYMRRVSAGLSAGTERMTVISERGALCALDGAYGLGPAVGVKASDRAVDLARRFGVGLVSVRNSTNFGAAGFYALRLARSGMIGLVTTNAPKMMAPHGAADAFLGSNPIAIAIPLGEEDEFVLDMSSTVTARGKIRRAKMLGEPLPSGWALDADGRPTRDAADALAGILLPVGGAKGSGLALAVSLLVGLLAGADFDDEVASIYVDGDRPQNLGQVFLAIDPSGMGGAEGWPERAAGLVQRLTRLRRRPGVEHIHYPGAGAASRARRRTVEGVPLTLAEMDEVAAACRECGAPGLAERVDALKGNAAHLEMEVSHD